MKSLALEHDAPRFARAKVLLLEGGRVVVDDEGRRFVAQRAASCLLAPEAGDLVLCDAPADGPAFVLAVLQRDATPARLCFPGHATIETGGHLRIDALTGFSLTTPGEATFTAPVMRATTGEASIVARTLGLVAGAVRTEAGSLRTVADHVDVVADRLWSRVQRAYRFVAERDQVRAGSIDHRAEQTVSVRGKNAMMIAEELVKLDGGQVHVG